MRRTLRTPTSMLNDDERMEADMLQSTMASALRGAVPAHADLSLVDPSYVAADNVIQFDVATDAELSLADAQRCLGAGTALYISPDGRLRVRAPMPRIRRGGGRYAVAVLVAVVVLAMLAAWWLVGRLAPSAPGHSHRK